jgi:hypothetical protein
MLTRVRSVPARVIRQLALAIAVVGPNWLLGGVARPKDADQLAILAETSSIRPRSGPFWAVAGLRRPK